MESKEVHVGWMQAELKQFGTTLEELVAEAGHLGSEVPAEYHLRLQHLAMMHAAVSLQLQELITATENGETLKAGVERAWVELEFTFRKLAG